jgi:hypothetical protein
MRLVTVWRDWSEEMTGPQHYQAAEALLDNPAEHSNETRLLVSDVLRQAQVHATLALAASLGLCAQLPPPDQKAWQQVAASPFGE